MDGAALGALTRSTRDKHVLVSSAPLAAFDALLGKARTNEELLAIYTRIDPWSVLTDIPPQTALNPSAKLFASVDDQHIQPYLDAGMDRLNAIGAYVRNADLDVSDRLHLLKSAPPSDVHSMQRGENWIGDFYSADLVIDILRLCGVTLGFGNKVLDYGCSSGALLRAFAWAYPSASFIGTDPVLSSIEWAQEKLPAPNLSFRHQSQTPPLPVDDGSIDIVTAISIFSHHGINASKMWFDELGRVLKVGGMCVFTAHGSGSLQYYMSREMNTVNRYRELCANMLAYGFAFEEPWMSADEVGNVATDAEWGNSFYTPQAMISTFSEHFDLIHMAKRANQGNQDVYVIRKRASV